MPQCFPGALCVTTSCCLSWMFQYWPCLWSWTCLAHPCPDPCVTLCPAWESPPHGHVSGFWTSFPLQIPPPQRGFSWPSVQALFWCFYFNHSSFYSLCFWLLFVYPHKIKIHESISLYYLLLCLQGLEKWWVCSKIFYKHALNGHTWIRKWRKTSHTQASWCKNLNFIAVDRKSGFKVVQNSQWDQALYYLWKSHPEDKKYTLKMA